MSEPENTPQTPSGSMAAIRLVSLRMTSVQADRADRASTFIRSVDSYLESEITSPFSYKKLTPTAFALRGKCTSHEIDTYIDKLQNDLLEFLFGTEGDNHGTLLFFAGSDVEVAEFVSTTDERAIELARAYQKKLYERLNTSKSVARPPPTPVAGTRNLLFRGILLCPRRVLLSYAVTPETYESQTREDGVRQDVDLGTYLAFRGEEAVEFSIRIFNKVSYLLQTGDDHVRRSVFVVPLSYKSLLAGQDRRRFLDNIHQHPDWVRQNMILSVFRCPPTPGSSILQRFSGEFTPLFRTIDWQITDPDFAMQVFTGCHFHSLTFDMHTLRPNQRQKALTKFLQRTEDLRAMKLRPAISGVETRAELDQCLNHGVVYASGDAVTAALPSFAPAQTIELRDLPISEPTILDLGTSNAA